LIAAAQRGSERSAQELVLRHINFVSFRLHRRVFPHLLRRFGQELLSEAIPILYAKIQTYDLDYLDRQGHPKPVKFVSYIWKRIDGHILDGLKRELAREKKLQAEWMTEGNRTEEEELGAYDRARAGFPPPT
jgi:hypothetical protein